MQRHNYSFYYIELHNICVNNLSIDNSCILIWNHTSCFHLSCIDLSCIDLSCIKFKLPRFSCRYVHNNKCPSGSVRNNFVIFLWFVLNHCNIHILWLEHAPFNPVPVDNPGIMPYTFGFCSNL